MSCGCDPWRQVCLSVVFVLALCTCRVFTSTGVVPNLVYSHACMDSAFNVECGQDEKIVIETARFGRNDTIVAMLCATPFQRDCDIDVHFTLNRACAGKRTCSLEFGTGLFGDPCGYEEFLRVTHRCVPSAMIHQRCRDLSAPALYGSGYIASPNYPNKYYTNAECAWKVSVQKRQTIRLTLIDFELDVKKGGHCNDYMEIRDADLLYFSDCGSLGKEQFHIKSDSALIRFSTGMSGLTHRGFLVHFEAIGPGCGDIDGLGEGSVIEYHMVNDELYANVSCREGLYFEGTHLSKALLHCSSDVWDRDLRPCKEPGVLPVVVIHPGSTSPKSTGGHTTSAQPASTSVLGVVLGIICTILLVLLLLVFSIYLHRSCKEKYRRRHSQGKYDKWQVVNNLQYENEANDEHVNRFRNDCSAPDGSARRQRRVKNKNRRNDDGSCTPDYNLLCSTPYDDGGSCDKLGSVDDDICLVCRGYISNQRGLGRGCICHPVYSRSSPRVWVEPGRRSRSKRDLRHCRTRSGQWSRAGMAPTPSSSRLSPDRRRISNSAPDLFHLDSSATLETNVDDSCCSPQPGTENRHPNNDSGIVFSADGRRGSTHGNARGQNAGRSRAARILFT